MWNTVEEIANSAIEDGRRVVSATGMTEPGVQGVVRKVSTESNIRHFSLMFVNSRGILYIFLEINFKS